MAVSSKPRVIGCIPSRYASTRLPAKPLCDIGGQPMVLHVLKRALQAKSLDDVVVLTDDERILGTVQKAGYKAVMTSTDCASGTDRLAEYMRQSNDGDVFVNMQGDEVLLDAHHIDQLVASFVQNPQAEMGTLAHWVSDPDILKDPTTAKVVTDQKGNALYFSRHCIPVTQTGALPEKALIHVGVYIYTRETLGQLTVIPQTPLEQIEKLEQLRALESGINIDVVVVDDFHSLSVDTPADLKKAQAIFNK